LPRRQRTTKRITTVPSALDLQAAAEPTIANKLALELHHPPQTHESSGVALALAGAEHAAAVDDGRDCRTRALAEVLAVVVDPRVPHGSGTLRNSPARVRFVTGSFEPSRAARAGSRAPSPPSTGRSVCSKVSSIARSSGAGSPGTRSSGRVASRIPRAATIDARTPEAVEAIRRRLDQQNAALVSVLAYEGLRPGEAYARTWQDVLDVRSRPRERLRVHSAISGEQL
jgi:integrase